MLPVKFADALVDLLETHGICIPPWSAAVRRESITVDVNDVDVDRAKCVALFEDARALVNESIDAAIDDFLRRNLALPDSGVGGPFAHQFGDFRIASSIPVFVVLV